MAGGRTPRDLTDQHRTAVLSRTGAFWAWVEQDLERPDLLPQNSPHEQLGYRHTVRLPDWPFDIHVVGLDSAWLAGDDHDAGKIRLTRAQVDLLTTDEDGQALSGFRIGLVHHPLSDLADGEDAGRRLADTLDLLLHGHQHDPVVKTLVDPDRTLRVLAAGCLFEGNERDDYKNSYQRIDIWLDDEGRPLHGGVQFRGWSPRGHWYPDASLYKNAPNGRLAWNPWSSDKPALATPKPAAPPTGVFIGREPELVALKEALVDSDAPAVSAIHGMAGVGKSYLALRFAREQTVAFPGGLLSLPLQTPEMRSAAAIIAQLAEQISVAPAELAQRLLSPRSLLVVDNIDTESNAKLAAELVDYLPGSPILFLSLIPI